MNKKVVENNTLLEKEIISFSSDLIKSCYGIVDIAKINPKISISSLTLKNQKKVDGVIIKKYQDGTFSLSFYLVVKANVKISEVLLEAQKVVLYQLNKKYPSLIKEVNLYATEMEK